MQSPMTSPGGREPPGAGGRRGGPGGRERFEALEDRGGRRREQAGGRGWARRRGWTRGGEVLQVPGNGTLRVGVSAGVRAERCEEITTKHPTRFENFIR